MVSLKYGRRISVIAKITSKNQITLPKEIVEALHLHKGDFVSVKRKDNFIFLTPQTFEDKYPEDLLERVEKKMEKGEMPGEKKFASVKKLLRELKK